MKFYATLGKVLQLPQLDRLVANRLNAKSGLTSAVSDIFEGLTQGKIAGRHLETYGHLNNDGSGDYWKNPVNVKIEATAHLFEALVLTPE